ncbi:MAG: AAA family ATPase, partial [Actinomadura sp.]
MLPEGMGYGEAYGILQRHERDAETPTSWDRQFNYRPDDGAHATREVLLRMFGMAMGESRQVGGFFGTQVIPSETRDIAVSLSKRLQVPWGMVTIPRLPGLELMLCDRHPHPEYGQVFELHVEGPRKYKAEVEAILNAIEEELRTNSIYRGQALTGSSRLEFFDVAGFDAEQIVFADQVERTLNAKLWSVLRYPDVVRQQGVPLKRAVLLYGPYGTDKTSAGIITGQISVENGWTFLSAKTGDNIEDVLRTARLYQKAVVVFFEDIDRESANDEDGLAELLDAFDGVTAKGGELIVVMTTNRYQDIPKGMLRPGRLDAVVKIAELDRGGTE